VRPIGLDLVEVASSTNATIGAFGPPQQRGGARRVQSPEAMAIEDHPAGPTKYERLGLVPSFSYQRQTDTSLSALSNASNKWLTSAWSMIIGGLIFKTLLS